MSEVRKRSRKSKLEVRDDVEIVEDEPENTFLQELPRPKMPKFLQVKPVDDHTYSRVSSTPPPMEVKIEVEEFDESDLHLSPNPQPEDNVINTMLSNPQRNKTILASNIDIDRILKVSDHIAWSSNNLADKCLNIELKNYWGQLSMHITKETLDPYDQVVQDAIEYWSTGGAYRFKSARDSPLFYQCHICNLAWWNLYPFREHIRVHELSKLYVSHQGFITNDKSDVEISIIIATDVLTIHNSQKTFKYIPLDGNCQKCGENGENHRMIDFTCKQCNSVYGSCLKLRKHQEHCLIRAKTYGCDVCYFTYTKKTDWQDHLRLTHSVRSDDPIHVSTEICNLCNKKYLKVSFQNHYCMKVLKYHCKWCYRLFATRKPCLTHMHAMKKNYPCKICGQKLDSQCQEAQHAMTHTDNYVIVHKCIVDDCKIQNKMVFPNIETMRLHRSFNHDKHNKRNLSEIVIIPKQCLKFSPLVWDKGEDASSSSLIIFEAITPSGPKLKEIGGKNTQTKQVRPLNLLLSENSEGHMSYEQLLSNIMFQGAVHKDELNQPQEHIKIKAEPIDIDYDEDGNISQLVIEEHNIKTEHFDEYCDDFKEPENESVKSLNIEESVISVNVPFNVKQEPRDYEDDNKSDDIIIENVTSLSDFASKISSVNKPKEISSVNEPNVTLSVKKEISREKSAPKKIPIVKTVLKRMSRKKSVPMEISSVKSAPKENPSVKVPKIITHVKSASQITSKTSLLKKTLSKIVTGNESEKNISKVIPEFQGEQVPKNVMVKSEEITIKTEPLDLDESELMVVNVDSELLTAIKQEEAVVENCLKMLQQIDKDTHLRKKCKKETKPRQPYEKKKPYEKKIYTCRVCGFSDKHKLYVAHKLSMCRYAKHNFTCTKCGDDFPSLRLYLYHFVDHGYESLTCPVCEETFLGLDALVRHFNKHIRQNYVSMSSINENAEATKSKNVCNICKEEVSTDYVFKHWELHFTMRDDKFGKFYKEEKPIINLPDHSPDDETGTNKSMSAEMLQMALRQLRTTTPMKVCVICYRKFVRRHECKRHVIEHLLSDAYAKKCNTPEPQALRCQECDAPFMNASSYKFHMRGHGGMPVYRCNICNKTFSDSSNFAKHKKVHDLKVLVCDICKKKFQIKATLEKHILMHNELGQIPCELCDKQFHSRSSYNKHLKVAHSEKTSHKCNICGKHFKRLKQKWDHAWLAHGERVTCADCPICMKGFRKYLDLKKHAKQEHSIVLRRFVTKSRHSTKAYKYFYKVLSSAEQNVVFLDQEYNAISSSQTAKQ